MERFGGVGWVDLEEMLLVEGLPRPRGVVGSSRCFFWRFGGFRVQASSDEE